MQKFHRSIYLRRIAGRYTVSVLAALSLLQGEAYSETRSAGKIIENYVCDHQTGVLRSPNGRALNNKILNQAFAAVTNLRQRRLLESGLRTRMAECSNSTPQTAQLLRGVNERVTDNLIALYSFDEGAGMVANDSSNVGTAVNLALDPVRVQWLSPGPGVEVREVAGALRSILPAGKINSALVASDRFSVEVNVSAASVDQTNARILTISNGNRTSTANLQLTQEGSKLRFLVRANSRVTSFTVNDVFLVADQPYHIVVTYDGLGLKVYVDAQLRKEVALVGANLTFRSQYPLTMANEVTLERLFLGKLLLAAIYSQALTPDQILANFNAGTPQVPPPSSSSSSSSSISSLSSSSSSFSSLSSSSSSSISSSSSSSSSSVAMTACSDGLDNDGDGFIDLLDPACLNSADTNEATQITAAMAAPTTYVRGSGATFPLTVSGDVQALRDVIFQSWHNDANQIQGILIDTAAPFVYSAAALDTISPGSAQVQAIIRERTSTGERIINTLYGPNVSFGVSSSSSSSSSSSLSSSSSSSQSSLSSSSSSISSSSSSSSSSVSPPGWTNFQPSSDSRLVYVDTSNCNAGNQAHSVSDPAIGPDPRSPLNIAAIHPVCTLQQANNLIQNPSADWILLRTGKVWNESLTLNKTGRSATARIVITSYGSGARPRINGSLSRGGASQSQGNLIIAGLELSSPGLGDGHGIEWQGGPDYQPGGGSNVLIEDCYIHGFSQNIALQGMSNVVIRRNVIADAYSTSSDQPVKVGLYIGLSQNLTIEENIFLKNGLPTAGWYHHHVYLQSDNRGSIVFRKNFGYQSGSHGVQARTGGTVEDNLFVQSAIGILFGGDEDDVEGSCSRNIVMEGVDTNPQNLRGVGITLKNTNATGTVANDNIVARKLTSNPDGGAFEFQNPFNSAHTSLQRNIVYQWNPVLNTNGNSPAQTNNSWQGGTPNYPDPTRSLDTYAQSVGLTNREALITALRAQSRNNWNPAYTTEAMSTYFRAGFGR